MRRQTKPQPTSFFSGRELLRLLTLLVMLAVIGMTIYNFRASSQSAKLALSGADTATAPGTAAPADKTDAAAAGSGETKAEAAPETEGPAEHDAFANEAQVVMDLATAIHPVEMPAYNRLLQWAGRLRPSSKAQAATITFHDLIKKPNQNRAKLMKVRLRVRRVQSYPLPSDGPPQTVYELWGWPVAADGWLYVVVTPELPKGFPAAGIVDETVDVVGYFFKLQGYHPAESKPNAKPLAAPLVIGKVEWLPAATTRQRRPVSPVALVALGMVVVSLASYWFWPRKKKSAATITTIPDEIPPGFETADNSHDEFAYDEDSAEDHAADEGDSSYEARSNGRDRERRNPYE